MTPTPHPYPAHKPSGVSWLGDMPEHWDVRRLKAVCRLVYGDSLPADARRDGAIPVYGSNGPVGMHIAANTEAPCIVVGRKGSFGKIQFSARPVFAIDTTYYVDERHSTANLAWLSRVLGWLRLDAVTRDSAVPGLSREDAYDQSLPLPPLLEQAAIVRYLDYADRRIRRYLSAKRKLTALLEEERQAIVNQAVTRGLDPNVRLKPSGVEWFGDVPEHWEVLQLGRVIDLVTGFPFKSEGFSFAEGDIRLLRGVNVSPGRLRWMDVVRWPNSDCSTFDDYRMEIGDIVLGMDRPFIEGGVRVASLSENDVPALLLQRVARIRPRQKLSSAFTLLLLTGKSFVDYLTPLFTGISVPHVSPEQIKSFRIALPSIREQNEIVDHVMSMSSSIQLMTERARRQIELLQEYRTRLIADVVTGKLDVREAAAQLPDEADDQDPIADDGSPTDDFDDNLHDALDSTGEPAEAKAQA